MNRYRNIDDLRTSLNFEKVPTHSSLSFSKSSLKKISILVYGQKYDANNATN